ncbi:MAG: C40 family peptidase [Burkholderiales bacterium]
MKIPATLISIALALHAGPSRADESRVPAALTGTVAQGAAQIEPLLSGALDLVGIRYRRGGVSVETGFDCSGFVAHVFREHLGLDLPRTTYEIARLGSKIAAPDLRPGDLVFFNTMRNAFSHVGIYLGDGRFVHSPRPGRAVRVENMREPYWSRRYNGARRLGDE